jgi:16S rRNA (cytidine1402-2'-O)-methyltransferase
MGKLFLVPTPIGNLEDITLRALRILKESDLILAEDTRTSKKLLDHYGIKTSLRPYHQHNEHKIVADLAQDLQANVSYALITDAGTPGISDPGFLLVRKCLDSGVSVESLPGATAFIPALINSGLPAHSFAFEGFLPPKKGRQKKLKELEGESRTMIFYESPYRLLKTLSDFCKTFGKERKASVSRELTKIYEETVNGTLQEISEYFEKKAVKGEFVIVVEGKT